MLGHLTCHHSGRDGLQPGVMASLKESLPLRVAVSDQRLPTTTQADRLLEPADFGHDLGFAPRPSRLIDSLRVSDFVMLFCSFAIRNLPRK